MIIFLPLEQPNQLKWLKPPASICMLSLGKTKPCCYSHTKTLLLSEDVKLTQCLMGRCDARGASARGAAFQSTASGNVTSGSRVELGSKSRKGEQSKTRHRMGDSVPPQLMLCVSSGCELGQVGGRMPFASWGTANFGSCTTFTPGFERCYLALQITSWRICSCIFLNGSLG